MASKIYIGIDIGKDGGIAVLNNKQELIELIPIPKNKDTVDELYLFVQLYKYRDENVIVGLEDVHSIFGASAKSNHSFGDIKGLKRGFVIALSHTHRWKYVLVQPKEWQGRIWTNSDKVYQVKKPNQKQRRVDTKATSKKVAQRMFPQQDFLRTP